MRYFIIFIATFFLLSRVLAQPLYDAKRDYRWVLGHEYSNDDSLNLILFNFAPDSLSLSYLQVQNYGQGLFQTNTSICDENGNLLLFSNGCVIADSSFEIINGAEKINDGPRWPQVCTPPYAGYVYVNGAWSLPIGKHDIKVLYCGDNEGQSGYDANGLVEARIEPTFGGQPKLIYKDRIAFKKNIQPQFNSVNRHGNGRDWWFILVKEGEPMFYSIVIDTNSLNTIVDSTYFQELSTVWQPTGGSQSCFSPDGKRIALVSYDIGCTIFDFDRCSGQLSNPVHFPLPLFTPAITGVAISPNSRFMYLMLQTELWQYDLLAPDIPLSGIKVAVNDGWTYSNSLRLVFYQSQLGPDGKIYVFPPAGRASFSVIEQPDSLGLACNVIQHKYFFPDWGNVSQPPRFPNFRLGPLVGSPCDTLVSSIHGVEPNKASMVLRPNPATSYAVADISLPEYSAEMMLTLTITDLSGSEVAQYQVPPYAALQRIETEQLPNGVYFVSLYSKGRVLKTERLVVLRL